MQVRRVPAGGGKGPPLMAALGGGGRRVAGLQPRSHTVPHPPGQRERSAHVASKPLAAPAWNGPWPHHGAPARQLPAGNYPHQQSTCLYETALAAALVSAKGFELVNEGKGDKHKVRWGAQFVSWSAQILVFAMPAGHKCVRVLKARQLSGGSVGAGCRCVHTCWLGRRAALQLHTLDIDAIRRVLFWAAVGLRRQHHGRRVAAADGQQAARLGRQRRRRSRHQRRRTPQRKRGQRRRQWRRQRRCRQRQPGGRRWKPSQRCLHAVDQHGQRRGGYWWGGGTRRQYR